MAKAAFMFPGQGTQFVGMTRDIVENNLVAAGVFDLANNVSGRDIRTLVFEGPESTLNLTENTQPCLLTAEIAIWKALTAAGVYPDAYLGFSLGEWSALVASGVLSYVDALRLVMLRGEAMQRAVPIGEGGMAVVLGQSIDSVQDLCERAEGYVEPSNYNCPGQVSVAGSMAGIRSLLAIAATENIAAQRIAVSIPSHCRMMEPAANEMREGIRQISFSAPDKPIVMNCCAQKVTDANEVRKNIILQLTSPVRMQESIELLLNDGFDTFVEMGPGKTLSRFVQKCAKAKGYSVQICAVNDMGSMSNTIKKLTEGK